MWLLLSNTFNQNFTLLKRFNWKWKWIHFTIELKSNSIEVISYSDWYLISLRAMIVIIDYKWLQSLSITILVQNIIFQGGAGSDRTLCKFFLFIGGIRGIKKKIIFFQNKNTNEYISDYLFKLIIDWSSEPKASETIDFLIAVASRRLALVNLFYNFFH